MPRARVPKISRHLMYREVAQQVERMIKCKKLRGQLLAPERELADLFGVSRETIRRSLAILERQGLVARRHGQGTQVLPRHKARSGSRKRQILVASYGQGTGSFYASELLAGLSRGPVNAHWSLTFNDLSIPAMRRELFTALTDKRLDGLLLVAVVDRRLVEEIRGAWAGPLVLVDHYFPGLPVTGVIDDSQGGAVRAVEHLLALGHRRIGYLEMSRRDSNPWRYAGYAQALRAAGVKPTEELIVKSYPSFESGQAATEELLSRSRPPTAIFAFDDLRAWGAWRAAEARGLQVGRDFAIVGYGDTAARVGFPEELSSVRVDLQQVGRLAAEKLEALIEGRDRPGELVTLPTELIVRASSKDARVSNT